MPEAPQPADSRPGGRWGRRDVLLLGAGTVVPALAGCTTSNPLPPGPGSASSPARTAPPSASPAPAPGVPAVATAEQALSVHAAAILTGPHRGAVKGDLKALLTFLRDAHADHAVALAGADPTARPTTATPSPTAAPPKLSGQSLSASLKALARAEARQASAQRRAAGAASGLEALLAGSLATAADTYASALGASDPPPVARIRTHRPAPLLTDVQATQQLVAQLHAVVYGYQLAIGKLKYASGARKRAVSELAGTRALLDTSIAFLLGRKADVPAAEPAYASGDVRTPGDATRLVRGMQTRLEAYVGLTLAAAATPAARASALGQLRRTVRTARAWGAGLQAWPGWPD